MARLSQHSSLGADWSYQEFLQPPYYKEEYRIAIDILIEEGRDAYFSFLERERLPEFLSEIDLEHIERHLQRPHVRDDQPGGSLIGSDIMEHETDLCSSSSGTYWPMDSEISVPDLELGWPSPTHFLGATNVAVHFHPPVGEYVPTIKQIVRKHIKEARKLVAVVMDIFTDVDIFEALVEAATAHRVPVYILHDEINFPYFDKMCQQHGLDPERLQNMIVRTLPGCCYHCKSGMKFSGQTLGKLLLIDFEIVICGTYSFTWAHEKIHRSMVEVFAGEIVQMFEEEFRILYAQSRSVLEARETMPQRAKVSESMPLQNSWSRFRPMVYSQRSPAGSWASSSSNRVAKRTPALLNPRDSFRDSIEKPQLYARKPTGQWDNWEGHSRHLDNYGDNDHKKMNRRSPGRSQTFGGADYQRYDFAETRGIERRYGDRGLDREYQTRDYLQRPTSSSHHYLGTRLREDLPPDEDLHVKSDFEPRVGISSSNWNQFREGTVTSREADDKSNEQMDDVIHGYPSTLRKSNQNFPTTNEEEQAPFGLKGKGNRKSERLRPTVQRPYRSTICVDTDADAEGDVFTQKNSKQCLRRLRINSFLNSTETFEDTDKSGDQISGSTEHAEINEDALPTQQPQTCGLEPQGTLHIPEAENIVQRSRSRPSSLERFRPGNAAPATQNISSVASAGTDKECLSQVEHGLNPSGAAAVPAVTSSNTSFLRTSRLRNSIIYNTARMDTYSNTKVAWRDITEQTGEREPGKGNLQTAGSPSQNEGSKSREASLSDTNAQKPVMKKELPDLNPVGAQVDFHRQRIGLESHSMRVTQPEVGNHQMNKSEEDSKQHESTSAKDVKQEEPIKAPSGVGQQETPAATIPSSQPLQNSTVLPQPSSISASTTPVSSGSSSLQQDTAIVRIPVESNANNSVLVKEDQGGETQEELVNASAESHGDAAANSAKEVKENTGAEDEGDEGNSNLLEKIEHMRKDNKVYSRFEVFYKQDGVEKDPKTSPVHRTYVPGYTENRSTYRPFLSSYRSSNHYGSDGYRSTSSDRTLSNIMQRLKFSKRAKRY
uniref:protein FAM83H-like n=1 Tax=Myxine glutinosa TaxID=7769 RepID=UPI00358FD6BE